MGGRPFPATRELLVTEKRGGGAGGDYGPVVFDSYADVEERAYKRPPIDSQTWVPRRYVVE
jgi:hypothetical protein